MFEGSSFGKSVGILQRSMDVSMLRRDVIANNIANADVPNYKRVTVNFESFLKRALDSESYSPPMELATTDSKHIPLFRPTDWRTVEPRRVTDFVSTVKNNGNNVDAETELMDSLNNQLSYTLMAQSVAFEFAQANSALRSS